MPCTLCQMTLAHCRCGTTPAGAAQIAASPPVPQTPRRLEPRYGALWCKDCGMQWKPIQYCTCRPPVADQAAQDGADSGLAARIAEAMTR